MPVDIAGAGNDAAAAVAAGGGDDDGVEDGGVMRWIGGTGEIDVDGVVRQYC